MVIRTALPTVLLPRLSEMQASLITLANNHRMIRIYPPVPSIFSTQHSLFGNDIGDAGAIELADVLQNNTSANYIG